MEAEKRDEGLNKSLDSSNKGFALLQKMGYKPGAGIGKSGKYGLPPRVPVNDRISLIETEKLLETENLIV